MKLSISHQPNSVQISGDLRLRKPSSVATDQSGVRERDGLRSSLHHTANPKRYVIVQKLSIFSKIITPKLWGQSGNGDWQMDWCNSGSAADSVLILWQRDGWVWKGSCPFTGRSTFWPSPVSTNCGQWQKEWECGNQQQKRASSEACLDSALQIWRGARQ